MYIFQRRLQVLLLALVFHF